MTAPDERRARARAMHAAGASYRDIATALGVTYQRAWQLCGPVPEPINIREHLERRAADVDEHVTAIEALVRANHG